MVQNILSDMDSEEINSISDSNEAAQIASVIENTYFGLISARAIPEHSQTIKLTSFSSSVRPTHFSFPARIKNIEFLADSILLIRNDVMPVYYTSFDDENVVLDSYMSSVDSTLTSAKTRAYGVRFPTFDSYTDTFIPDIDDVMFPYLLAEAKSTALSLFKSGTDPKIEQLARRQKVYVQNDLHRLNVGRPKNDYGRR